jgi:hypothetical protein
MKVQYTNSQSTIFVVDILFNFILTGQVSPTDDYGVYYCERMPWCKKINF